MLTIREMQPGDVARARDIEKACFGVHWTATNFEKELASGNGAHLVALWGDELVGYIGYWLILEEVHITAVAVDPQYRRMGIGEQLLIAMTDHCKTKGAKWMTLEVRVSNVAAQKLYEKYGFKVLGRRKQYYHDNQEDALVMWTENIWHEPFKSGFDRLRDEAAERMESRL